MRRISIISVMLFVVFNASINAQAKRLPDSCNFLKTQVEGYRFHKIIIQNQGQGIYKIHLLYDTINKKIIEIVLNFIDERHIKYKYRGPVINNNPPPAFQDLIKFLKNKHKEISSCIESVKNASDTGIPVYLIKSIDFFMFFLFLFGFFLFFKEFFVNKGGIKSRSVLDMLFRVSLWYFFLLYFITSLKSLPYDVMDLWHLLPIEFNKSHSLDLLHPLYPLLMHGIRNILWKFGYKGRFLTILEVLNICAIMASFVVIYDLSNRFASFWASVITLILWGLQSNYILSAGIRAVPYAWAALTLILTWYILITKEDSFKKFVIAGIMSGFTAGFHMSAGMLWIASVLYIFMTQEHKRMAFKQTIVYLLSSSVTLLFIYFMLTLEMFYFDPHGFISRISFNKHLILEFQQVPHSSILDASISHLFSAFWNRTSSLWEFTGLSLSILIIGPKTRSSTLTKAFLLNLGSFWLFFQFFNVYNGFLFSLFILLPSFGAFAITKISEILKIKTRYDFVKILGCLFVIILLAQMSANFFNIRKDRYFSEVQLLNRRLGVGGLLIIPGINKFETSYFAKFKVFSCMKKHGPDFLKDKRLLIATVREFFKKNKKVLYTEGYTGGFNSFDKEGEEWEHQIFVNPCGFIPKKRKACVLKVTKMLKKHFELKKAFKGPLGDIYYRVIPRPGYP